MKFSSPLSRRSLLQKLGAASVVSPFLPLLAAEHSHAAGLPKRICFFHTPNGLLRRELVPGADFSFKRILAPLQKHKSDILFLEGLHMKSYYAQGIPNDHPPPLGHLMTGANTVDPKDGKAPSASSSWFASDVSIDQYLGRRIVEKTPLRYPAMVLGNNVGGYGWHISHTGDRKPILPDNDAGAVFRRLLDAGDAGSATAGIEMQRLRASRKSVRDMVREDLKRVLVQVSSEDKQKIEAHLALIADVEKRESMAPTATTSACAAFQKRTHSDGEEFIRTGKSQMDNIAMAFACDQTRVALLQWDICATNRRFTWAGVNEPHHDLAHQSAEGSTAEGLTRIGAWYAEQFAYLIDRLKGIPEAGGTMFDNTLLVWLSEHSLSSGDHGRDNLPFILAGSLGGAFKTGRMVKYDNAHNDLYVSLCHAMGFADVQSFGNKAVCKGPLPGLV